MMNITVSDDVGKKLQAMAEQRGISVDTLLTELLDTGTDAPGIPMRELARIAQQANLASEQEVDTAARSREILRSEYADYLKQRTDRDVDDDSR